MSIAIHFKSASDSRSFSLSQLPLERYSYLQEIISVWQQIASEKKGIANSQIERKQFSDCDFILGCVQQKLDPKNLFSDEVFVCHDTRENLQAVMVLKDREKDFLDVENLVTNPINIRSLVNLTEPNRVSGAGSSLMSLAERIALQRNKSAIRLNPLDNAVGFYERHGYVWDPDSVVPGYSLDMIKAISRAAITHAETA